MIADDYLLEAMMDGDRRNVERAMVKKPMKEWGLRFWKDHGDRLLFMTIAAGFGMFFYFCATDMQGEGKAILIGVATLAMNKARGVVNGKPKE